MKSKKSKSRRRQPLPSLDESVRRVRRVLQREREERREKAKNGCSYDEWVRMGRPRTIKPAWKPGQPVRTWVISNGVTMPLPEKGEREALEHERAELEDALVDVVGEIQRDKLRRIIAEQMPQGAEPNTTEQRKQMIRRVLAAFEGTLIQ